MTTRAEQIAEIQTIAEALRAFADSLELEDPNRSGVVARIRKTAVDLDAGAEELGGLPT